MLEPLKENFIHLLQLLASGSEQDRYQSEVAPIDIASELICMWFDGFFENSGRERLAPFLTDEELRCVDEFHDFYDKRVDLLPKTYAQLRESALWREVIQKADETLIALGWDKVQTTPGFGAC